MLQCSNVFPGARNGPRLVVRVRVCRPMKHPHKRSSGLPGRSRAVLLRMFTGQAVAHRQPDADVRLSFADLLTGSGVWTPAGGQNQRLQMG